MFIYAKAGFALIYRSAQEKIASCFRVSPWNTPYAKKKYLSRRKLKITYFVEGFLREISRRWVGKDLRFLRADSEDSDQTEKLSESPA